MKKFIGLLSVAIIAGIVTLGGYKMFFEEEPIAISYEEKPINFTPVNYPNSNVLATNIDFTEAAEKTIHAVVHVKNTTISNEPANIVDYFYGRSEPRELIGSGSGVIISPDGHIITNNHVIENATKLQVTLNNNKIYEATLIGTDPNTDIALIKIDADVDLPYIPFGDSNEIKVGEWVLAVGNPFNLTSTVTAGIVSAKARDLNEFDNHPQSFIQTDAAVNQGNSGGALVNTRGELIGINTAITSRTGSFVGYSFAVPSNNARKVIEDILEYGNVQRGILGIRGGNVGASEFQRSGVSETEGVYVASVEIGSGAERGGIRAGDIIKKLDNINITNFTDLVGYVNSKRPNDVVNVTVLRNGNQKVIPVTLIKLEIYESNELGLEVKNTSKVELDRLGISSGLKVTRPLTQSMANYNLTGIIITEINDQKITDINSLKRIMNERNGNSPIKMTFVDRNGKTNNFIFR